MINCIGIFQDQIFAYIIRNYISKTLFLSFFELGKFRKEHIIQIKNLNADLIVVELSQESKNDIEFLLSNFDNKYFILFEDTKTAINISNNIKATIMQKNLTYFEFVEGLSLLIGK